MNGALKERKVWVWQCSFSVFITFQHVLLDNYLFLLVYSQLLSLVRLFLLDFFCNSIKVYSFLFDIGPMVYDLMFCLNYVLMKIKIIQKFKSSSYRFYIIDKIFCNCINLYSFFFDIGAIVYELMFSLWISYWWKWKLSKKIQIFILSNLHYCHSIVKIHSKLHYSPSYFCS